MMNNTAALTLQSDGVTLLPRLIRSTRRGTVVQSSIAVPAGTSADEVERLIGEFVATWHAPDFGEVVKITRARTAWGQTFYPFEVRPA